MISDTPRNINGIWWNKGVEQGGKFNSMFGYCQQRVNDKQKEPRMSQKCIPVRSGRSHSGTLSKGNEGSACKEQPNSPKSNEAGWPESRDILKKWNVVWWWTWCEISGCSMNRFFQSVYPVLEDFYPRSEKTSKLNVQNGGYPTRQSPYETEHGLNLKYLKWWICMDLGIPQFRAKTAILDLKSFLQVFIQFYWLIGIPVKGFFGFPANQSFFVLRVLTSRASRRAIGDAWWSHHGPDIL